MSAEAAGAGSKQREVMNSRRTLAEITQRVEDAIDWYEKMEETEPEIFSGLKRPAEVESGATFKEMTESENAQ